VDALAQRARLEPARSAGRREAMAELLLVGLTADDARALRALDELARLADEEGLTELARGARREAISRLP
jgi:hypothetical protein